MIERIHRLHDVAILTTEIWCLRSSQSWSEGMSIQDDVMNVARSVLQGAHYHTNAIYLLLK